MNLEIPVVGQQTGPLYAQDVNDSLSLIDAHNHTPGYGVQIPAGGASSGINVIDDLSLNSHNLTAINTLELNSLLSATSTLTTLQVVGADLYFRDGNNILVRLTEGGSIFPPPVIPGLTPPASLFYQSFNQTFVFESNTVGPVPANLDAGNLVLRNYSAGSHGLTLQAPTLTSDYSITLPTLAGSQAFLTIDASGVMSAAITFSAGITGSNIAANTVTGNNIVNNVALNGDHATLNSGGIVVNKGGGMSNPKNLLWGTISAGGSIITPTFTPGFSVSHTASSGIYSITYSTAYAQAPAVVVTPNTPDDIKYIAYVVNSTTTGCQVVTGGADDSGAHDTGFNLMVMGNL